MAIQFEEIEVNLKSEAQTVTLKNATLLENGWVKYDLSDTTKDMEAIYYPPNEIECIFES